MSDRHLTIALAGNPNSGKTTAFNALTGSRQHVGNYPGVTVEKKTGTAIYDGRQIDIVDLPGTYSLTAYSIEEIVARNFVIDEDPDAVIDIIDSANLERNLYLAMQFVELGVPLVLAFNKSDLAQQRGYDIDVDKLSGLLGVPIVQTVAHRGEGLDELLVAAVAVADEGRQAVDRQRRPVYGHEVEPHVEQLAERVGETRELNRRRRWFAIKLLENDEATVKRLRRLCPDRAEELLAEAGRLRKHVRRVCGDFPEIILADGRYGHISGACIEAVEQTVETRHARSDQIDAVLTHHIFGLPIFALAMYLMFQITFSLGNPMVDLLDGGRMWLAEWVRSLGNADSLLISLLADGIIEGVGAVIVFVPLIALLFLSIAILEDSGYMARAAFVLDKLMHKIGLHGKSFIPMLIGFGCTVPAIMATRTLENRRDRLVTMMITPLMSCGARFPIYALIIPAFFPPKTHGTILWLIYLIGIIVAVFAAKVLRATVLRGETTPLVMELPPYHVPTVRGVLTHMWERAWLYMKKAGTVILAVSIVLWALTSYPKKTRYDEDYGAAAQAAEAALHRGLRDVSAALGLDPASVTLSSLIEAEREVERTEKEFGGDSPQHTAARRALAEAETQLRTAVDGAAVVMFLKLRDGIRSAHETFDKAVKERRLIPDSPEYVVTKLALVEALRKAAASSPKVFAAADIYLADVIAPFHETLTQIAHRKRSEGLSYTITGRIGRFIEPALKPLGFDWKIGTALIGAFGAKEIFVSQMGIVYSVGKADEGSEAVRAKLKRNYSPLVGFCIMLFCLLSTPCVATVAVTMRESGSWKWGLFQLGGLTALAYVLTLIVYQAGSLLKIGVG